MKSQDLDQFYTNPSVATTCTTGMKKVLEGYYDFCDVQFFEPSAGTGNFIEAINNTFGDKQEVIATDIEPKHPQVKKMDFLTSSKQGLGLKDTKSVITIGNPPFGKKSALALAFFKEASLYSDTIAFIVPLQFRKWSVQSKIHKNFKLILDIKLDKDSFIFENKKYDVNTCFQVWTRLETKHADLRLKQKPAVAHPDFKMWQYNNTEEALKVFKEEFDFAVPRQGYYDFSIRETDPDRCEKNKQWILFKAKSKEIYDRLYSLNFDILAQKNTSVPGFGKADVVEEYNNRYGNNGEDNYASGGI